MISLETETENNVRLSIHIVSHSIICDRLQIKFYESVGYKVKYDARWDVEAPKGLEGTCPMWAVMKEIKARD